MKSELFEAVFRGDVKKVKFLFEHCGYLKISDGQNALIEAARSPGFINKQEIAIYMVQNGYSPSITGEKCRNVLDWAIQNQNIDLIEICLECGVKPQKSFKLCKSNSKGIIKLVDTFMMNPLKLQSLCRNAIREWIFQHRQNKLNPFVYLDDFETIPKCIVQQLRLF